jgi:thioredoxin 1
MRSQYLTCQHPPSEVCYAPSKIIEPERIYRDERMIFKEVQMNNLIHVTDAEFQEKVLNSELPVVVDFWAPWCGPCRMIALVLEEVAKENEGKILIAKVNTDENSQWAMDFGVQGIPTLLFIAGGEVKDHQVGAGPAPALKAKVESFLEGAGEFQVVSESSNGNVQ